MLKLASVRQLSARYRRIKTSILPTPSPGIYLRWALETLVDDQIVDDSTVKVIQTIPLKDKPAVVRLLSTYVHMVNPCYESVSKRNAHNLEIHILWGTTLSSQNFISDCEDNISCEIYLLSCHSVRQEGVRGAVFRKPLYNVEEVWMMFLGASPVHLRMTL